MRELVELTEGAPEISLAPGEALLREGDASGRLFVLVEGQLVVRKGAEELAAIDAPGACVGEMSVLLGRPHTATVVATAPTVVRVIEDAHAALDEDPAVLHAVATLLARRLDLVNIYLADLQRQYGHVEGGLGLISDMVHHLATHHGDGLESGSDREPDPLY